MHSGIAGALKNWLPHKLAPAGNDVVCRWLLLDGSDFREPFFDETIARCLHLPENSMPMKCASSLEMLPEWAAAIESVPPTAFIFHVSRCGSTLATQLLAQSRENIVLSEVPFFDELLRGKKGIADNDVPFAPCFLKAAIQLYAARRNKLQHRLFIKTDSWHLFFYKQIRELYPDVPFILLYRHPAEVIRSQQKRRGIQAIPGLIDPSLFGFDQQMISQMPLDAYMGKVLESFYQTILDIASKDSLAVLVNYGEGFMAMMQKIGAATGMPLGEKELEAIQKRAGFHAKYPEQLFQEEKESPLSLSYYEKALEWYDALESLRRAEPGVLQNKLV